jgi:hypothetical protein
MFRVNRQYWRSLVRLRLIQIVSGYACSRCYAGVHLHNMSSEKLRQQQIEAIESPIFANDTTYGDISAAYERSDFGGHHADQPLRFKPFHYKRNRMIDDLGNDVHPVQHMRFTEQKVLVPFLMAQVESGQAEDLSVEDIKTLRFTARTHDTGECTHPALIDACGSVVGDVPHHDKTNKDEAAEESIRHYFYEQLYPNMPTSVIVRSENIIMQHDTSDPLTALFRAVEDVGYFKTGIRAANVARINNSRYVFREHISDTRLRQVGRMGLRVSNGWHASLKDREHTYPYIAAELEKSQSTMRYLNTSLLGHMLIE